MDVHPPTASLDRYEICDVDCGEGTSARDGAREGGVPWDAVQQGQKANRTVAEASTRADTPCHRHPFRRLHLFSPEVEDGVADGLTM